MTVQECYESIGADFEGVLGRMGSEAMVKRFALKFLDEPSYRSLVKAVEEQNAENAFRAAHTLKGICLNQGLDRLCIASACLTEKSTPAEAVDGTVAYLVICFMGIPFITAYNIISSIFRGMGDSQSLMY